MVAETPNLNLVYQARMQPCLHLTDWPEIAPRRGDLVWCSGCRAYRSVFYVFTGMLGARAGRGRVKACGWVEEQLRCSEPASHVAELKPHYDESFSQEWRSLPEHDRDLRVRKADECASELDSAAAAAGSLRCCVTVA